MLLRRIPSAAWHVSRHAVATAHAAHASAAHVMGSTTHAWSKETLWTSTDSAIRSRLRRRRNPSHALLRWIRRIGDVATSRRHVGRKATGRRRWRHTPREPS